MKPPEILSMVEEAAGTKMYEAKRSQCLKAIADNETKLNEIDRMLKDDIEPTMERLKGERAAYMEFQKVGFNGRWGFCSITCRTHGLSIDKTIKCHLSYPLRLIESWNI